MHGDALYFSHLPIPFDRDNRGGVTYWKHIGLYAYRRAVLDDLPLAAAVARSSGRSSSSSSGCWRPASRSACSRPTSPPSAWIPRRISGPPRPSCRRARGDQSLGRPGPDHGRPGHGQRRARSASPPSRPLIREDLGLSVTQAGSFLSAYYIGPVLISLPAGWLADRWGVRGAMILGQGLIAIGLFAAAAAPSFSVPGRDPGAGRRRLRRPQPHHHQGGHGVVPAAPARHRRGPQADRPAGRRRAGRADDAPAGAGLRLARGGGVLGRRGRAASRC